MKDIDFDKYKSAWEEEKNFDMKILSESELSKYLKKRSKGITNSFRIGLIIDIILKIILGISSIFLIWLYSNHAGIITLCSILFALTCYLLLFQFKTYDRIPRQEEYSKNLRIFLENKIRFYRTKYFKSVYIIALSNPIIFISGILFYFHFKYSGVRSLDFIDFFVFSLICITGFILGALIQTKQYNFHIRQMEECLNELDDDGIYELILKKQVKQQKILLLIFIIILVAGLSALGYILIL